MAKSGGLEKTVSLIVIWGVVILFILAIMNAVSMGGLRAVQRDLDRRVKAGWAGR